MSSDEESHSERQGSTERRRASPPRKDDRRSRDNRRRSSEDERSPDRRNKRNSRDHRDRNRRSRSRSPRDRRRKDRRGDKPIIPQRPKLFQRPAADVSTSNDDPNSWSTRIAAVASDDGQRSKFEKLLGMHKSEAKPALKSVSDEEKKAMQKELSKMTHDLDNQYEQSRAFTHSFKGRGL